MKLLQNSCLMTPPYQYHYRIYLPHRLEHFVVGVFRSYIYILYIFQKFPINFGTFDPSFNKISFDIAIIIWYRYFFILFTLSSSVLYLFKCIYFFLLCAFFLIRSHRRIVFLNPESNQGLSISFGRIVMVFFWNALFNMI